MFLRFLVCEIGDLMFLYNSQPYEMAKEILHAFLAVQKGEIYMQSDQIHTFTLWCYFTLV